MNNNENKLRMDVQLLTIWIIFFAMLTLFWIGVCRGAIAVYHAIFG